MDILTQAGQLILSLSILVILHELGHFIPARLFKTRVEKFYLFFDPWFSLFKFKKGDTEYGIGWLPLGGYVKIAGMIDESLDKEQLKQDPQEWEFRAKPAWQRLIIMIGGVTVNLILGFIIYSGVLIHWGEEYLPTQNAKYGIMTDSLGMKIGLQNGDKIVSVDNKIVENFNKIHAEIIINQSSSIQVDRNGETKNLEISSDNFAALIKSPGIITPRFPFVVADFTNDSFAKTVGIEKGDSLIACNDSQLVYFDAFKTFFAANKNQTVNLTFARNGEIKTIAFIVPESGLLGIYPDMNPKRYFETKEIKYNFLSAIPAGISKGTETLGNYMKQLKLLVSPETKAYESLGGFITIGKAFDTEWNWQRFWNFTAFFSIVLAIMNLLPIPALDGGHVVFLIYEVITSKKPSEKVMEYAQYAGMIILFSLMIFANLNDVIKLFQ